MNRIVKKILKVNVAMFAGLVCTIALLLPYEARKKYSNNLVRFKELISVIF